MFNEKPNLLNLEARVTSSGRSFDEIPIWLPSSYGGFGDIMVTLKLAEGLKKEFPDKKVTVYFGKEEDYQKVQRLYPHFDPSMLEAALNGVSVAHVSDVQLRNIMSRNVVGVYSPVAVITEFPKIGDFVMDAGINFYLEEYDAREKIMLPEGIRRDVVYEDRSGRKHVVLSTGFDENSIGIHIDSFLTESPQRTSPKDKQEILNRAGFQWITGHVPNLMQSEWGLAYYVSNYHFRIESGSDSLLRALLKSFKETGNWERAITIFDFSKVDPRLVKQYNQHEPFTDIFLQEDGKVKVVKGSEEWYGKLTPVYIVHVGHQDHSVFVDFLRHSEIPVAITGDASLAETVSLNKPFMYHPPGWKSHVFPHFVEKAPDLLDDWRDADRIRSLFGCRRVKEENVENYAEVEKFYLEHREDIHRAKELERECIDKGDYRTKASHLFGRILRDKGVEQACERERDFEQHNYAFSMAYYTREQGRDKELRTLRKRHIFGTGTGMMGDEEASRLFYDPEYQTSFHRFNQALIQQMDISKNLANLIREAARKYQG